MYCILNETIAIQSKANSVLYYVLEVRCFIKVWAEVGNKNSIFRKLLKATCNETLKLWTRNYNQYY